VNAYIVLAKYLVVAGIGAGLCLWGYAYPRVAQLEVKIAKSSQEAQSERSKFLEDAKNEQERLQGLVDSATRDADSARLARDRATRSAGDSDVRMRRALAIAIANQGCGLPKTTDNPEGKSAPATIREVVIRFDDFAGQCAIEADRLGDEVRRLEASR
jgi:hypothetical protein